MHHPNWTNARIDTEDNLSNPRNLLMARAEIIDDIAFVLAISSGQSVTAIMMQMYTRTRCNVGKVG